MAYRFNSNKLNGKAQIHIVTANSGDIIVAGNSTVSNLTVNSTSGEVLTGAYIRRVIWSTDTRWVVNRGGNTMIVLTGTGDIRLDGMTMVLDPAANISVNTAGATTNGFIMLEVDKVLSAYSTVFANAGGSY